MKYPRTHAAYHQSHRDNSDRIDALLAESEKLEDDLSAARVVAVDAIREIERILSTGDTYCTKEIVANLKEFMPE